MQTGYIFMWIKKALILSTQYNAKPEENDG